MAVVIFPDESYRIIGLCIEVHKRLGLGFKEVIYKDALEFEFKSANIPFIREQQFKIEYKGVVLPHRYFADFVLFNGIILEVKSAPFIADQFVAQTINYLKASGIKLGIIVNFGEKSFISKRVVLT